ncbi:MAG: PIG-L family deacetylase [Proteobacteria bacterium]|nr:PIG-L family deacetylase [Pseudomonadota bacterium]
MKKICIVSPHLDDAILSCGVLMQRHVAASDEVSVLNIFSAGTNSENRKQEDLLAQKQIGASPFYLDELDAPDRNSKYKPLKNLFFSPLTTEDESYIDQLGKRLSDFFSLNKVEIAYFPLAAGTHIDHRIAFEVGKRIKTVPVKFYEDRPYILWPGVLQSRMQQIGSNAALPPVTGQMMRESINSYYYLRHFVPDTGNYRREALSLYVAALNQESSAAFKASGDVLIATAAELRKLHACLCLYTSQMKYIYKDYDNFIRDSFAYERTISGRDVYAERSWTIGF